MALYHKHRPKTLDDIVGNKTTVLQIRTDFNKKEKPHAVLLVGPTGCGKTTIGRIIANMLDCKGNDLKELNAADWRGIDTIRDIRQQSQYKSLQSPCRVWLLDEAGVLTKDAQNAMLKLLEETPKHVYFILATTDPQKLINTLRGRCAEYSVAPLREAQMVRLLKSIVHKERKEVLESVIDTIVERSQGLPRNALQALGQVIDLPVEKQADAVKSYAETETQVKELCRGLFQHGTWQKISRLIKELQEQGEDAENIRRAILGYCHYTLLNGDNVRAAIVMEHMIESFYYTGFPGLTFACYSIIKLKR